MPRRAILGTRVDATRYADATTRIAAWAARGESRTVCCANVHMVMEARDNPSFHAALASADLVTADGMPLAWGLRLLGISGAPRVYGPRLMLEVCAAAADRSIPVALFGSTPETLARLERELARRFPGLPIVFSESPPFRERTAEEDEETRRRIEVSGARILFAGLGCPRQERWMALQRGLLPAVMLGVGAAFDFVAGTKPQAPPLVGRLGLEWIFRLAAEPRRLWRRYLLLNPRFVGLFTLQLARAFLARARTAGRVPAARQELEP
jgi:N-acetylglucosaminyldiphosphoundecaprenol N-acetyl-beta-D-mannosaminyltransferase